MLNNFKRLFREGAFTRQMMVVLSGTAGAQGIAFLGSILLARIYNPESFGIYGLFTALLAVLAVFSTLRYEQAIPISKDSDAAGTVALVVITSLLTSCIVGLVFIFGGAEAVGLAGMGGLAPFLPIVVLTMLFAGISQALTFWAIRAQRFDSLARSKVSLSLGSVGAQLGLSLAIPSAAGLVLGRLIGRIVHAGSLAADLNALRVLKVSRAEVWRLAKRYRSFPLFGAPSTIIRTIGVQSPILLLAAFHDPVVVGLFSLGQRTAIAMVELVAGSVKQVFLSRAGKLGTGDPLLLLRQGRKLGTVLFAVAFPFAGLFAIFGPTLFALLFGEEWREAGVYIRILTPMLLVQFTVIPVAQLDAIERQGMHFAWTIVRTIILFTGYTIVIVWTEGTPSQFIAAYAVGNSISLLILGWLWVKTVRGRV